jgi:hypothetical protein
MFGVTKMRKNTRSSFLQGSDKFGNLPEGTILPGDCRFNLPDRSEQPTYLECRSEVGFWIQFCSPDRLLDRYNKGLVDDR